MLYIYCIISFVFFYIGYQIWEKAMNKKCKKSDWPGMSIDWSDTLEFWKIILTAILWPVIVPGYILWKLMDKITNKYFKNEKNS